jgi:hypothetical protein
MLQSSWFTRLDPLGSILGALLTGISLFFPLFLIAPAPFTGREGSDVFLPTLNGGWLLRSLLTPQNQLSPGVTWSFALLVALAAITLGVGMATWFLQAHVPGVVSWIRAIAAVGGLVALLWLLEGVALLNFQVGFGPGGSGSPKISMGFGMALPVLGTALSALGLGVVGIDALVGAGIGYLVFLTPLGILALFIGPITCILGALVGWWIARATSKGTPASSS